MTCPYWSPIKHVTMAITELVRAERKDVQLQNVNCIFQYQDFKQ